MILFSAFVSGDFKLKTHLLSHSCIRRQIILTCAASPYYGDDQVMKTLQVFVNCLFAVLLKGEQQTGSLHLHKRKLRFWRRLQIFLPNIFASRKI